MFQIVKQIIGSAWGGGVVARVKIRQYAWRIFSVPETLALINHNESRDIQMLEILYLAIMPEETLK